MTAAARAQRCARIVDLAGDAAGAMMPEFLAFCRDLGFQHCAIGSWTVISGRHVSRFLYNDWPQGWIELYERENLGADDPVVATAGLTMRPFSFTGMRQVWCATAGHRRVVEAGEWFGWTEVFAVPVHGAFGYRGLISLASISAPAPKLAPEEVLLIEGVSRHALDVLRRSPGVGLYSEPAAALTRRQIECLKWVAAGKTDVEAALVLGLSAATVHFHVEAAKKRLGVGSRAEAVARLVLDGLL